MGIKPEQITGFSSNRVDRIYAYRYDGSTSVSISFEDSRNHDNTAKIDLLFYDFIGMLPFKSIVSYRIVANHDNAGDLTWVSISVGLDQSKPDVEHFKIQTVEKINEQTLRILAGKIYLEFLHATNGVLSKLDEETKERIHALCEKGYFYVFLPYIDKNGRKELSQARSRKILSIQNDIEEREFDEYGIVELYHGAYNKLTDFYGRLGEER